MINTQIREGLHDLGITLKTNNLQQKTTCPKCSHNRKNKKDPCLSVNLEKGFFNCHNCGWSGNANLKQKKEAFNKLIDHACKSFNIKLLNEDGTGLARAEIAELVGSFINWINDVKKKLAVLQTSSETLESSTPDGDLTVETPNSSLSSTEKELSAEDQSQ